MASNFEEVAKQFVDFYYSTFDTNRGALVDLYKDESMLTFEQSPVLGSKPIVEKLTTLPFQQVKHQISTLDAQPSINGGVLVLVTGQLLVDEEQRPMNYTQTFHLMPSGNSFYVYNDIFRLVYG